jgi:integrase
MSVHRLPDGRWFVQYRIGMKYRREYFGRGMDAEKAARIRNTVVLLDHDRRREKVTPEEGEHCFWELVNEYLESRFGSIEPTTLNRMMYKFKSVILPALGDVDVRDLTPQRLDAFVNRRLRQGLTKTTVHGDVTLILSVINWGVRRRHVLINPLAGYEKLKRDDVVIQPATQDELKKILKKSPPQLKRAIMLSYYTGLRPGRTELFRLRWSDVDWTAKTILVRSAKKKGPRSRTIPIHPSFLPTLQKWWRADKKSEGEIIFYKDHPITTLRRSWATAKKEAGITRRFPPYAIRHAFVTNLLSSGADLKATSEIAGHSRPDTTMRVYHHTDLRLWRRSIKKLPALT